MKKILNYYEIIGLNKNATKEEIEAKKETYFSDFAKENNMSIQGAINFYMDGYMTGEIAFDLDDIWDTLLDDNKRREYDELLAKQEQDGKVIPAVFTKNNAENSTKDVDITKSEKNPARATAIIMTGVCIVTLGAIGTKYAIDRSAFRADTPDKSYIACDFIDKSESVKKHDIDDDKVVFLTAPNYTEGVFDSKFVDNLTECLNKKKEVGLVIDLSESINLDAEASRMAAILDDCLGEESSRAKKLCTVFINRTGLTGEYAHDFVRLCVESFKAKGLKVGFILDPSSYFYNKDLLNELNVVGAIKTDDKVDEPFIVRNNTFWDHVCAESDSINIDPELKVFIKTNK